MDEELIEECIGLITWIKQWYFTPEYVERMDKLLVKLRAAQQSVHPTVPCTCETCYFSLKPESAHTGPTPQPWFRVLATRRALKSAPHSGAPMPPQQATCLPPFSAVPPSSRVSARHMFTCEAACVCAYQGLPLTVPLQTAVSPVPLRLVGQNGTVGPAGRLEVLFNSRWGTVRACMGCCWSRHCSRFHLGSTISLA